MVAATVYTYDEAGRLASAITTWEPEWLEEDVAWAKAYLRERADHCPGCGLPMTETMAMQDGEPVHTYLVRPPARCHACTALHKAQDKRAERSGTYDPSLFFRVERQG